MSHEGRHISMSWIICHSIMLIVTWRRFDQSAKQLVVGRTTNHFACVYNNTVTVIPPTQEDTVLGSRKNTVRVRNYSSKSQLVLLYSMFHKVILHHCFSYVYSQCQTPTDSDPLWLSLTNRLCIPVYICGSTSRSVSTSAQTFIAKPNMVRNGALTSYSGAPSLINSQHLLGKHIEVSRQPRGTPTFHIRQPGRLQNIVAC